MSIGVGSCECWDWVWGVVKFEIVILYGIWGDWVVWGRGGWGIWGMVSGCWGVVIGIWLGIIGVIGIWVWGFVVILIGFMMIVLFGVCN